MHGRLVLKLRLNALAPAGPVIGETMPPMYLILSSVYYF